MSEKYLLFSDIEFEALFTNCKLDPTDLSHEAHLRLAYIHISRYGVEQAEQNIQAQLKKFVTHVGAQDKYHLTLTVTAVRIMNHFMHWSSSTEFDQFLAEFPQIKQFFRRLISTHYAFDIFNSEKARNTFVEPDRMPFQ